MSTLDHPPRPAHGERPPLPPVGPTPPEHDGAHLPQPHVVAGEGAEEEEPEERSRLVSTLLLAAAIAALVWFGGWGITLAVLGFVISIFLHEMGHYLTAKASGMKVTEFFLAFGPRLWSFRRGETEYGVKAIPAGAYVKIIGMNNLDEVDPADEAKAYRQKPYHQRLAVAFGGPGMNLLIGLVLIWVVLVFWGQSGDPSRWTVDEISNQDAVAARIEQFDPDLEQPANQELLAAFAAGEGPAQVAGIEQGDRVVAIDGQEVDDFGEMSDYIRAHPGDEVTLEIERDGETIEATTTIGTIANGVDGEEGGFLGLGAAPPERETSSPIAAVPESFQLVGEQIVGAVQGIGRVFTPSGLGDAWNALSDNVDGTESARESAPPSPRAGAATTGDEERAVSIVGAASIGGQIAEQGFGGLLAFLAAVNIFLAVFNLVPLLPFDGGHIVVATYEKIREMISGERRYMADVSKLIPLTYGVVMVIAVFGFLLISNDILDPPQL
jgi:membrane-associated protease RseP (regulator of RpoE activity)